MSLRICNFVRFIVLLFGGMGCAYASDASIILRMQDMNHEAIKQAMRQAPFILQVELKNIEGYNDSHLMQYIPGIENFKASKSMSSHNVSVDNGKKSVKTFYNFVLRADKKGNFTVGPIVLKDKTGQHIRSNRLIIPVGDELIGTDRTQKDKYFITMTLDKKQAYVGEKVGLTIKFYDRLFVDDLHLQFPEFKNISIIKSQNNLKKSMVELEGEEYSVTEWNFDLYPLEPGTLMIQDVHAAFFAPELESKFKFGGAFDFFRSLHKSEQYVVAKPIKLDVLMLPKSQSYTDVHAVGQFSQFRVMVNQQSAPVGQGIVLSTELLGNANFEMMPPLDLVLPEGFKYYDSNMVAIDAKRSSKRSEFIVQADTPGVYTIPAQVLHYFDPISEQYKKIESNEVEVTITPAVVKTPELFYEDSETFGSEEGECKKEKKLEDFTMLAYEPLQKKSIMFIPLEWYKYLLWLLSCVWILLAIYRYILEKYLFQQPWCKKFVIFYRAKRMCQQAEDLYDVHKVALALSELFANLIGVVPGQLHDSMILEYLDKKCALPHEVQAWKKFYNQLLRTSFSAHEEQDKAWLFSQALVWIEYLKEKA